MCPDERRQLHIYLDLLGLQSDRYHILLPIVQEVYDSGVEVDRILVQPGNVLEFILANGNVITRTWKDHSRRESWTPEKREQARQKTMRYHSERRACANE